MNFLYEKNLIFYQCTTTLFRTVSVSPQSGIYEFSYTTVQLQLRHMQRKEIMRGIVQHFVYRGGTIRWFPPWRKERTETPLAVRPARTDSLCSGGLRVRGRWEEAGKGDFFPLTKFQLRSCVSVTLGTTSDISGMGWIYFLLSCCCLFGALDTSFRCACQ